MSNLKIVTIIVLFGIMGVALGGGVMGLNARRAAAQSIGTPPPAISAQFPDGGHNSSQQIDTSAPNKVSTVGVGGSFVTDVYKSVSPAVVHVTNHSVQYNPFYGERSSELTGSGVIVDARGYVLTNFHVIENANDLQVILNDGRSFPGKLLGKDPGTDLALVKIEAGGPLPFARLGDSSKLDVGEWVVAIGNPSGLDWTVTVGVVSALGREIQAKTGQTMRGMIQTDAAINPGNSGGPLLNASGEIIGINDAIISETGQNIGIGLAIPVNTAKEIMGQLEKGDLKRPWLGIVVAGEVDERTARRYQFPVNYGVVVGQVFVNSPAAAAGLIGVADNDQQNYDILTDADGQRIDKSNKLLDIVRNKKPGDHIKLSLYRMLNGKFTAIQQEVTLTELPKNAPLAGFI